MTSTEHGGHIRGASPASYPIWSPCWARGWVRSPRSMSTGRRWNVRPNLNWLDWQHKHQHLMTIRGADCYANLLIVPFTTNSALATMLLRRAAPPNCRSNRPTAKHWRFALLRRYSAPHDSNSQSPESLVDRGLTPPSYRAELSRASVGQPLTRLQVTAALRVPVRPSSAGPTADASPGLEAPPAGEPAPIPLPPGVQRHHRRRSGVGGGRRHWRRWRCDHLGRQRRARRR